MKTTIPQTRPVEGKTSAISKVPHWITTKATRIARKRASGSLGTLSGLVDGDAKPIDTALYEIAYQAGLSILGELGTFPASEKYLPADFAPALRLVPDGSTLSAPERLAIIIIDHDARTASVAINFEAPGTLEQFIDLKMESLASLLREAQEGGQA